MIREIKFRAKRSDDGKWVYGDLTHTIRVTENGDVPCIRVAGYNVDEDTIGQYTGCKDMNGNEIYEWDFLRLRKFDDEEYCVICVGGTFELDSIKYKAKPLYSFCPEHCVDIIGNLDDTWQQTT